MTLIQLRHLIAIVDSGLNLTVAAERVHATQPGLSKQLKALEDELGFPVFLRNGKRLTGLTELGSEVAQRARLIVDQAKSIRANEAVRVTRGQVIGLMGDTGSPGAVHLHFEYWRSGGESDAVDPAPLLRSIC